MLKHGWNFRSMTSDDLDDVLRIINDHDEDDHEAAQASYQDSGLENQYVLTVEDVITGMTGFSLAEGTDRTYWLSWTYVDPEHQGNQMGTGMLEALFDILSRENARKIFVSTSDYVDPERGSIYQNATKLYKTMGFKEEIVHPDFYAPGEATIVYGRSLIDALADKKVKADKRGIALLDIFEIDETDDTYAIEWAFSGKRCFGIDAMNVVLEQAKSAGARSAYISFPSNANQPLPPLQACGFEVCGQLQDYYTDGVHETRFRYVF